MPYFSTERVERDGVLVYAEGSEIPAEDLDELRRQGLLGKTEVPEDDEPDVAAKRVYATKDGKRVGEDDPNALVLVAAEGDPVPSDDEVDLLVTSAYDPVDASQPAEVAPAPKKAAVVTKKAAPKRK